MKTMRWGYVTVLFAGARCAAIGTARAQTAAHPERVLPTWVEVQDGAWPVPPQLVRTMEQRLQEGPSHDDLRKMLLLHRPAIQLDDYTVQYRGERNGNTRLVRLLGNCRGHASQAALDHTFLIIADGGPCIFDATYSPDEQRFTSFAFHSNI